MKSYALPEDLANSILQYLSEQPYIRVVNLINGMSQLKEVPQGELIPFPKAETKGE